MSVFVAEFYLSKGTWSKPKASTVLRDFFLEFSEFMQENNGVTP
jgi:hypothetical protein